MNMSIEKMLSHVYEIEGLMLVTRRLGEENTPDVITDKIRRKVRELAEMCGAEIAPAQPVEESAPAAAPVAAPEPAESSDQSDPAALEEAVEHLPEEDYDADETWQHDNGEEFKEVFKLDYQEPEHEVPVAEREPDEDITVEFIDADDPTAVDFPAPEKPVEAPAAQEIAEPSTPPAPPVAPAAPVAPVAPEPPVAPAAPEPPAAPAAPVTPPPFHEEQINDEPVPEPDPELVPEAEDEPDIEVEFIEADDILPEPEDEMPMPPLPTEFPEVDEPQAPMRVDEKLQRSLSKDIRKAFSLNDRFRFQRELFAGSANAMDTAIEHIEMMRSYGNAELYFFSQLHWDRDNQDVKDFMEIVRNHFQQR